LLSGTLPNKVKIILISIVCWFSGHSDTVTSFISTEGCSPASRSLPKHVKGWEPFCNYVTKKCETSAFCHKNLWLHLYPFRWLCQLQDLQLIAAYLGGASFSHSGDVWLHNYKG